MSISSDVSTGTYHSLILKNGKVYSFGDNESGQLGLGDFVNRDEPTLIKGFNNIVAISAGGFHSLFLTVNGNVYATGSNLFGQLGIENNDDSDHLILLGVSNIVAISAGENHSLLLDNQGRVFSFGDNSHGQLGLNDFDDRNVPTLIDNYQTSQCIISKNILVNKISAGGEHSLIITNENKIYSFGYNLYGQLGLGDNINSPIPQEIPLVFGASISAGGYHSLYININKSVSSFGNNVYGQLGLGDNNNRNIPTLIQNYFGVKDIAAGQYHSLLVIDNVYGFGLNVDGQLGTRNNNNVNIPINVMTTNSKIVNVCAGGAHTILTRLNSSSHVKITRIINPCVNGYILYRPNVKVRRNKLEFYSTGNNFYGQLGLKGSVSCCDSCDSNTFRGNKNVFTKIIKV